MAAAIAVTYPHMNGLGGDAFWLVAAPTGQVWALDGAGPAARGIDGRSRPVAPRGGQAALTVASQPACLEAAWELGTRQPRPGGGRPLDWGALLEPARRRAAEGLAIPPSLAQDWAAQQQNLPLPADRFAADVDGQLRQPELARTLATLQAEGARAFYQGALAAELCAGLAAAGSPLRPADLAAYRARWVTPLVLPFAGGLAVNLPPPTQGVLSLGLLGLLERRLPVSADPLGAELVHWAVEGIKAGFRLRDAALGDPDDVGDPSMNWLEQLDELAASLPERPRPGGDGAPGGTVWFGAMDANGLAVSVIQSLYHEFGSGVLAGDTGVLWHNRGLSFHADPGHPNALAPGKRPFHTLNPALWLDGRGRPGLVYGSMGGDGQPQFQAALALRHLRLGVPVAEAVAQPRWLYGRTWGEPVSGLRLEQGFPEATVAALRSRGHSLRLETGGHPCFGHAGMLRRERDGSVAAASDPRADGAALVA